MALINVSALAGQTFLSMSQVFQGQRPKVEALYLFGPLNSLLLGVPVAY